MITLVHHGCEIHITASDSAEQIKGTIVEVHENSGTISLIARIIDGQNIKTHHFKRMINVWVRFDPQEYPAHIGNVTYNIDLVPIADPF